MQSLYSKLSILKDNEDFFSNYKKNITIKQIQKDLNLSIDEAAIFCIIILNILYYFKNFFKYI